MLLEAIWKTSKLTFSVYKSILFGAGPIIKVNKLTLGVLGVIGCCFLVWSN